MVTAFRFHLNPTTTYFWLQYFCMEWDSFCVDGPKDNLSGPFNQFKFMDTPTEREDQILGRTHPFPCFN